MNRKIGAHVSAAGGIDKAIERVAEIGGNCLQLFSGSPRVWAKMPLEKQPVAAFDSNREKYNVTPVFTHALYLVNLASDKEENIRKSFASLKYELEFDSLVKGSGIIVHLGSHQGRGWEASCAQIADHIDQLLSETPDNSTFLIENSAGQNGKIASDLEEIRWLFDELEKRNKLVSTGRLAWCFDTCHGFAAGYRLGDHTKIAKDEKSAIQAISDLNLWETLKVVHVNDSKDPFGSGRDRHDNIGDGTIPAEELKFFLNYEKLLDIPLILEVPGIDKEGPDAENIERLRKIATE
ncbi:MAG: hypothetical protein COY80_03975 [Candidatus Pacebacteria bacterium CG_4_10_14_0_8_um_filter_42_14]|nr:MAG: hypothetical protein COY80_03975 [Candidatus Pacebacteria bacterium CG_4_10_14_0_8_um_filter_42_14]